MTNKQTITQEEFDKLPIGSQVEIKWDGGVVGQYSIYQTPSGENIVQPWNPNSGWWYGQVTKSDRIYLISKN